MKKNIVLIGAFLALFMSGCTLKPYVDTTEPNYATLQLVPKSPTFIFADDFYSALHDLNKVCNEDEESFLGAVKTNSNNNSRVVKIAAEKPLYIYTAYIVEDQYSRDVEYSQIALRPEKNRHYIIEYVKKKIDLFRSASEYRYYMQDGDKQIEIPGKRIGSFNPKKDCKKQKKTKI